MSTKFRVVPAPEHLRLALLDTNRYLFTAAYGRCAYPMRTVTPPCCLNILSVSSPLPSRTCEGIHVPSARSDDEPTSEQIITALRAAGWLLEQETGSALQRRDYFTRLGWAYPDLDDTSKSRELDVMAYKELQRDDELRMSVGIRCLVECKQSTAPYVLIGKPTDSSDSSRPRREEIYRFEDVVVERENIGGGRIRQRSESARVYLGLADLPEAPWNHGFLANQMTRLERKAQWMADNRGIFDSLLYPLAKATQYHRNLHRTSSVNHDRTRDWASVEFLYPMVVTSAPLYKLDVSQEPYEPEKVGWVPMVRHLRTAKLNGSYVADAVSASALAAYLDGHVQVFASEVQRIASDDPERFITSGYEQWT